MIFDQDFLPLALDTPVSNCKTAVLVLFRTGYFISPVPAISGEHFAIRHRGRRLMEDWQLLAGVVLNTCRIFGELLAER